MALTKRTPCVGICSTTYGDLVCRGCKRFAHEIVQWNGYDKEQQGRVWQRLHGLRDEVVAQQVEIVDDASFSAACDLANLRRLDEGERLYELLRYLVAGSQPLDAAGLAAPADADALTLLRAIDAEIYRRSLAHYERNFKIPV